MGVGLVLGLFVLAGGIALWSVMGRAVSAPAFLRDRVALHITEALPGLRLRFGDLRATLETSGATRVTLHDVDVTTALGAPVAQLSDLELDLAPLPLLQGDVHLTGARLSGAVLTVSRTRDGRIALAFGEMAAAGGAVPDLPALVAGLGQVFDEPALRRLDRVEADAITLRYEDARAGRGWTVDGGRLVMARSRDEVTLSADLALLGGGTDVATIALNADITLGEGGLGFGMNFDNMRSGDIATQSAALAWLDALRAPISGALRSQMYEDGSLGPLNATLQIGKGVLQPNAQTRPVPFDGARAYFTYHPDSQAITFDEVAVDSAWGRATAEGQAVLQGFEAGWPARMVGQFRLSDIETNPGGFFEAPVDVAAAEMDFRLNLDPFRLTLGRMRLDDPDAPLRLSGELDAQDNGWALSLDGRMAHATPAAIAGHWPPSVTPKTRRWFTENVLGGQASDLRFAVRLMPGEEPVTHLSLRFDDATVRYARIMPLAEKASGQFTLLRNRMVVSVEAGHVTPPQGGSIDMAGTHFVIPDVRQRPATGAVDLRAQGPVTAVLSLLNGEKLTLMDKAGLPVDLGQGRARMHGQLILPLKKGNTPEDIAFAFDGTVSDAQTDRVIKGRRLAADVLRVEADNTQLRLSGQGTIDGVAFDGGWTQPLGRGPGTPSRVAADVDLSPRFAETFGIGLPSGTLSGRGTGRVEISGIARGRAPEFSLSSSLQGLGIAIPALGWAKGQGQSGTLELSGALGAVPRIDRLSLDAAGLSARGAIELRSDRLLNKITLSRLRVGTWLDAQGVLRGRGRGVAPGITLTGGRVDLRGLPGGGAGAGGSGAPVSLSLDRLQLSDAFWLSGFQGEFTNQGGMQGRFSGALNGRAALTGEMVPHSSGRSAIRLRSERADRVVETLGILKSAQGGSLDATLIPTGAPGTYDGQAQITQIRMRDAPAVASLLDAMSIVGLLDQLGGPGIAFTEVDARFRLTPEQVIVSQSSAVGPSMGISLDGYYNLGSRTLDMQGVLSPIYLINGIGRIFSRKGEGLIGFNFTLRGPAQSPRVGVNPFSVLTPGMFREIFRRPPPQVTQ